ALPNPVVTLRQALPQAYPQVKKQASLGLAYNGDPRVSSVVFSDQAAAVLSAQERLVAALTLSAAGEDQLVVFLDDAEETLRHQALLLLMLRELKTRQPTPTRCLACL